MVVEIILHPRSFTDSSAISHLTIILFASSISLTQLSIIQKMRGNAVVHKHQSGSELAIQKSKWTPPKVDIPYRCVIIAGGKSLYLSLPSYSKLDGWNGRETFNKRLKFRASRPSSGLQGLIVGQHRYLQWIRAAAMSIHEDGSVLGGIGCFELLYEWISLFPVSAVLHAFAISTKTRGLADQEAKSDGIEISLWLDPYPSNTASIAPKLLVEER